MIRRLDSSHSRLYLEMLNTHLIFERTYLPLKKSNTGENNTGVEYV